MDGLRGLAILAVVFYHAYSRWPDAAGLYTHAFGEGHLGVQLFFLLSGFLIFQTLESSASLGNFLYRRWVRLFPAMLVASWLILTTSFYFYNRVEALPGLVDIVPGLVFLEPEWLRGLGLHVTGPLEGAFWTLFTEVKFYALFGAAFFLVRRRAVWLLAGLAAYGLAAVHLHGMAGAICDEINCRMYGWFAAGAFLHLYTDRRRPGDLIASAASAAVGVIALSGDTGDAVSGTAVYLIFIAPFFVTPVRTFFTHPVCAFFGFISYPLYLIHENATWAMIVRLRAAWPGLPTLLVPLLPMSLVGLVAWLIAAYLEPAARRFLQVRPKTVVARAEPRHPSLGPSAAAATVALLAALAMVLSHFHPVRHPRLERENQILTEEKTDTDRLENQLTDARNALANVQRARVQAQAYLNSMPARTP